MAKNIFDRIKNELTALDIRERSKAAFKWFENNVSNFKVTKKSVMEAGKSVGKQQSVIGKMYLYHYDPKLKKKLPYYDRFPLIFIVEKYDDGFLGINLHYLDYKTRGVFLKALFDISSDNRFDANTKLKLSYSVLQGSKRYKQFQPCLKRYLYHHIQSQLVEIPSDEWSIAIFLPVENFEKKSKTAVWAESKKAF